MKIMLITAARPNFMKIAPIVRAMEAWNGSHRDSLEAIIVHTGQHYDEKMSGAFLESLAIPQPQYQLGIGGGSLTDQVARTMLAFEPVLRDATPDCVVVVGDVNATLACALVAQQVGVPLAHVEAGMRSFDPSMPEELNRVLTDRCSDLLLVTDATAIENLTREGIASERIRLVGNVMIDTLDEYLARARDMRHAKALGLADEPFALITLHRPATVDHAERLGAICGAIEAWGLKNGLRLLFPIHPRTAKNIPRLTAPPWILIEPQDYLEMLSLQSEARVIITDSGGIQGEACVLGKSCVTVRDNTEHTATLMEIGGTNILAGTEPVALARALDAALLREHLPHRPPLWDGKTAERIVRCLAELMKPQQL